MDDKVQAKRDFEELANRIAPAYWQTTAWAREAWEIFQAGRESAIREAVLAAAPSPTAEQPERPPYCGSGHCSCIECPYGETNEP